MSNPIFEDVPNEIDETWREGALWGGMASTNNNYEMAVSFRKAAEVLVKRNTIDYEAYEVINPLLYLYRHAIELYLKAIISKIDDEVNAREFGHNILTLFKNLETYFEGTDSNIPASAKTIITEFANLDHGSFSFRYGEDFKPGEFWIDFPKLNKKMNWLFNGLENIFHNFQRLKKKDKQMNINEKLSGFNVNNVQLDKFFSDLFFNYVLNVNGAIFYFGELELYYHDGTSDTDGTLCFERNKKAGDIFFHDWGMDVCFETKGAYYGGILIRSLIRKCPDKNGKKYICGPLACLSAILKESKAESGATNISLKVEKGNEIMNDFELIKTDRFIGSSRLENKIPKKWHFIRSDLYKHIKDKSLGVYYYKKWKDVETILIKSDKE